MIKMIVYDDGKLIREVEGQCLTGTMIDPVAPKDSKMPNAKAMPFLVGYASVGQVAEHLALSTYHIINGIADDPEVKNLLMLEFMNNFMKESKMPRQYEYLRNERAPIKNERAGTDIYVMRHAPIKNERAGTEGSGATGSIKEENNASD